MTIICTCGNEIPSYKTEDIILDRSKCDTLVFPGIECSECGRVYVLKIGLEHIGTNPNRG